MGILLVYDITSESSFNNVTNWMKNIQEYAPETVCTILIGNKCDSENDRVSLLILTYCLSVFISADTL